MKKVSFIEGVSPRGHININRFYITELGDSISTIYVGNSLSYSYKDIDKVEFFDDNNLLRSRLFRAMGFVWNTWKLIYKVKSNKINTVCLLSYDPLLLFLVVYFSRLMGIRLYTFEHNTVPVSGWHKYFLQYICFRWVKRICYTPKAVKMYKNMGQKAIYIPHPIIYKEPEVSDKLIKDFSCYRKKYKIIVFCPSASASIDTLLLKAKEHSNILFIIKTKQIIKLNNVIAMPYFEDYATLSNLVDFFYLPVSLSESRVSGPFFEAIGVGKKIILQKGSFYDYAKQYFENYIYLDKESWEFDKDIKEVINIKNYNNKIISKLKDFIDA